MPGIQSRARFVQASSDDAWSLALQLARVSLQGIVHYNDGTNATRDAAMAKNVQWIAEREGPVGRVMLWAHNGHILHLTSPLQDWFRLDAVLMGRLLRMKFGRDYVAFGLAFDRGEVRNLQRKISTVGPTDPESLDGVLARVGLPIFALELPGRIDDVGAESWLKVKHATHMFGLNQNANGTEELPIRDCYEAMIFFAKTTAAHANPGLD